MTATMERMAEAPAMTQMDAIRHRFAEMWFNQHADEEGVTICLVDYLNTFQAEVAPSICMLPTASQMTRAIYAESEKIAATSDGRYHVMPFSDTEACFKDHITDEVADQLRAQGVSALPRAITLTIMDQIDSMRS